MKSILLFSAGKESIFSLYRSQPNLLLLFDYGQKAFLRERDSLFYYAALFDVPAQVMVIPNHLIHKPSGIVEGQGDNHVFFRNGIFLSLAANFALANGYGELIYGAVKSHDYHDGGCMFANDFDKILRRMYGLKITRPTGTMSMIQVQEQLIKMNVDMTGFWSCDGDGEKHCGQCAKCRGYISEYTAQEKKSTAYKEFHKRHYPFSL